LAKLGHVNQFHSQQGRIFYLPYPSNLSPLDIFENFVKDNVAFIATFKKKYIESCGYSCLQFIDGYINPPF
jgi:hypothetical protein